MGGEAIQRGDGSAHGAGRARSAGPAHSAGMVWRLLGEVARLAPVESRVPGMRQTAVLAYLLLRPGRRVEVDELIRAIWADRPPRTARNSLQRFVSDVRRFLDPGVLRSGPGWYLLDVDPDEVDATTAEEEARAGRRALEDGAIERAEETLQRCLARWSGVPLGGVGDAAFAAAERARLDALQLDATVMRVDAALRLGRHRSVATDLQRLVETHPFEESLWQQWMLVLYRSGRQGEALRAYERLRSTLVGELGIEPSPEVRALHRQILAQDPMIAAPGAQAGPVAGARAPVPPVGSPEATVGRDAELAAIGRLVASGAGGALLLFGEAGVGKSHLVEHALALAVAAGRKRVVGRASEAGSGLAFRPVAEVLARLCGPVRAGDGDDPYRRLVRRMFGLDADGSSSRLSALALGEAVLQLGTGSLIVLEDLHWADADTVGVVEYVVNGAAACGVAIVTTCRDDDASAATAPLRRLAGPGIERFDLRRFDVEETAKLVRRRAKAADAAVVDAVHRASDGLPLLVASLTEDAVTLRAVAAGTASPPPRYVELVTAKLDHLDPTSRRVVEVMALVGDGADRALVASVAGAATAEVAAAIGRGAALGLLDAAGTGFPGDLARSAVLDQQHPAQRAELARAAIEQLDVGADPYLVARLARACDDEELAARALHQAGRAAWRLGGLTTATALLRESLSLRPSPQAQSDLLEVFVEAGDHRAARELVLTADEPVPDELHARWLLLRARALRSAGKLRSCAMLLEQMTSLDPHVVAGATILRAEVLHESGEHGPAVALLAPLIADEAAAPSDRIDALLVTGRCRRAQGGDARSCFYAARHLADLHALPLKHAQAGYEIATLDLLDMTIDAEQLDASRREAVAAGAHQLVGHLDHTRFVDLLGRLETPADPGAIPAAIEYADRLGLTLLKPALLLAEAYACAYRLDLDQLERVRDELAETIGSADRAARQVAGPSGMAALLRGDLDMARRHFEDAAADRDLVRQPFLHWGFMDLLAAVERRDRPSPTWPRAAALVGLRRAADAVVRAAEGDLDRARALLAESLGTLARAPSVAAVATPLLAIAARADGWDLPAPWTDHASEVLSGSPYLGLRSRLAEAPRG